MLLYIGVSDGGVAYQLRRMSMPFSHGGGWEIVWILNTQRTVHTGHQRFASLGAAMDVFNACVVRAHTARFLRKVYDATDFHMGVPGGVA